MKICWFDNWRLGLVEGELVYDVSTALAALPPETYPPTERCDWLIGNLGTLREPILQAARRAVGVPVKRVRLRSPVANPGKIVAAPVNYQTHLEEAISDTQTFSRAHVRRIQETGLFLKATSALSGCGDPIRLIKPERRTDHEIELVAIIGRRGGNIPIEKALDHVAGYCVGLDITIRGPEERSLRKSPDTYAVLGPWLTTADEIGDPAGLSLSLDVNSEPRQRANTRDLILNVAQLISFASEFYTLDAGDVLFTGTPDGVGAIVPGDIIHAHIERLGHMHVRAIER